MKKKLLLPVLLCVVLAACNKQNNTPPDPEPAKVEKYAVSFGLSAFDVSTSPMNSSKTTTATTKATNSVALFTAPLNYIIYAVYDKNGNLVSRLQQSKLEGNGDKMYRIVNNAKKFAYMADFGAVVDTLPGGVYTVMVAASRSEIGLKGTITPQDQVLPADYAPANLSDARLFHAKYTQTSDLFYYKGSLIVTSNIATQPIILNRIVGQLVLNIEDAIPAEAAYYDFVVAPENLYYRVDLNHPDNSAPSTQTGIAGAPFAATDKGKTNFQYALNILNTTRPITANIVIYDAQHKVLSSKTVTDISVKANQKTILSGQMFQKEAAFSAGINADWGSNPTTVSF